ncbi:hypothetical protein DV26_16830 [Amycolatopsis mediterranei]|uniref:Secreted protein n=1 Tax=Amycolatopsis mediterranei (strain S699) TaxID=713604 RepID=A0A9R0NR07_AMYMS|nr:hypothetical protein RAM_02750 [Amycolatopsis mediterranei S699]KDO09735.1 hypothetical protein DV26_16830 [Amycolatopsis mediterranei]KDU86391.1 hypothetical protein DV36_40735 [Amycolatopsis mediterranei]
MRSTIVTALVVTGLAASSPSSASPQPGVASIGSASFTAVEVPPQAPCAIGGPSAGSAERVSKPGITFGGGTSSCTETKVTATGKDFELSALVRAGGPRVKLASFTVTCERASTQTSANWTFGGMSGIANPPNPVPVGYVSPLRKSDGTVLANAVFNIQDVPGDGSVGLTMLRIDFLPESGLTGAVKLGATSCSPTP